MVDFRMPSLGADMEAGTLVEWLIKPGDKVRRGDIVAVVETQKGAIEIEIFESGEIEEILVGLNNKVPVGTPLARLRPSLEYVGDAAAPPLAPATPHAPPAVSPVEAPVTAPRHVEGPFPVPPAGLAGGGAMRTRASPAARRLAERHGLKLAGVPGSGASGAVTRADVERHLAGAAAPAGGRRPITLDRDAMRVGIAAAMTRSKREIPHYYLDHQVDVSACERWLAAINAARPPDKRLLFGVLAVRSVALAARRFPAFNGFWREGRFEPSAAVHVGLAITLRGGGLAAPALHDADSASVDNLMANMRDLVQRMRFGRIRGSEIADPTITVSSLGERGVEALYGIIYPPQVALVGFGTIVQRPWVVDGAVVPRSIVTVTLAADHRVSDGHAGALFLAEVGRLLQEPDKL